MTHQNLGFRHLRQLSLVFVLISLVGFSLVQADDRDLVRASGQDPYLFVIFDVSGSMNWTPPDFASGLPEDRWTPGYGDDPNSKFYQAKSALFRTLDDPQLRNIEWGFATYNDDEVRAYRKHWLYTPAEVPPWDDELPYPVPGTPKLFGDTCMDDEDNNNTCDMDSSHGEVAGQTLGTCNAPQDLASLESTGEVFTFPVLGQTGDIQTEEWIRVQGREFLVTWIDITSGNLGDETIVVKVSARERNGCGSWVTSAQTVDLEFTKVYFNDNSTDPDTGLPRTLQGANEVLIWQGDGFVDGAGNPSGFWDPDDIRTTNTCSGWEPNTDETEDADAGLNLKYATTDDPLNRHATAFDRGDVIPWDWQDEVAWGIGNSNRIEIMKRLAPNFTGTRTEMEEFRSAPYFEDVPDSLAANGTTGRLALKPQFVNRPPLIPNGSTPIGNSMEDFKNWFDDWKAVAAGANGDPSFGCRTVNLLILTDGDETCFSDDPEDSGDDNQGDRNPCTVATELLSQGNRNIRTFVIGFGVPGTSANFLNCIAQNGGTDAIDLDNDGVTDITGPILPGNEQDLIDALKSVAVAVQAQSRSFASAAVPQAQINVSDKVYLTSFQPIEKVSVWPGRLDAYLRPVPLRPQDFTLPDGTIETRLVPDPTRSCGSNDESECHLWNAAEELLQQAPTNAEIMDGSFNIGLDEDQRRVFYSIDRTNFALPDIRRTFQAPTSDGLWMDMMVSMGICAPGDIVCRDDANNRAEVVETLEFFHGVKTAPDPNDPAQTLTYLLGDFFHSDPLVSGNPDNFVYWVGDLEGSGTLPLEDPCDTSPGGYRCFFEKHRNRRKVILGNTNDGQLHAFDAGIFRGTCEQGQLPGQEIVVGEFDDGSGREIFSYVPRITMSAVRDLKDGAGHTFTTDGRPAAADVFIDPVQPTGMPTPSEREWRTIVLSGLREGGSGYFALDTTFPDKLTECNGTPSLPVPRSGAIEYVPSCINTDPDCGGTRYPEVLWEFEDNKDCVAATQLANGKCDDDGNTLPDLADTWSTPDVGRIRVIPDGATDPVDMYVAIFGGGMDAENKGLSNVGGNFIYMVDVETGRAIYKRSVVGSAMADIAAVDTNQNGYIDTLYIGTTAGFLYKANVGVPQTLEDRTSVGEGFKVTSAAWTPFPILSTGGRPISQEVTVIFVPEKGQYALAVGTGDREDLWLDTLQEGRFYLFLDRGFQLGDAGLPLTDADLTMIDDTDANLSGDFLRQPPFGWYITLDVEERVISQAFSLAGVTVFSSFQPEEDISEDGLVCRRFGTSRTFVVNTTNANSLLGTGDKFFVIKGGFLSPAFAEVSQTKNPGSGSGGPTASDLPDDLQDVIEEIKKLLPEDCRFANYTINIKAVRDDTGIQFLAAVPICTNENNWLDR